MNTILIFRRCALVLLLFLPQLLFAQQESDSTKYLTTRDTLFVTHAMNVNGKPLFVAEHRMKARQTVYSLAKYHARFVEELVPFNEKVNFAKLPLGQVVKVPLLNRAIKNRRPADYSPSKYIPVCMIVQKGNTVKYFAELFKTEIDSIRKWNRLTSNLIFSGQAMQVAFYPVVGAADTLRKNRTDILETVNAKKLEDKFEEAKGKKKKLIEEQGTAFWFKSGGQSGNGLYCLHRTAPIGTIISAMNGSNRRTIFVKVVGKIPEKAYGKEVIAIFSPAAAKAVGAVDERFYVRLKYY
jgi:LysM repeat protein